MQLLNRTDAAASLDPGVRLEGPAIQLVPMRVEHGVSIQPWIERDRDAFHTMLFSPLNFDNDACVFVERLCQHREEGVVIPFAIEEKSSGYFLGYSRYLHIDTKNRTLHIGGTWIAPSARGTNVNPEAKRLMLGYAFEQGLFNRVTIQTDVVNVRSRRAIEKLGAKFEGIHRADYLTNDGVPRDTAVYSIVRTEWPEIRARLDARIA